MQTAQVSTSSPPATVTTVYRINKQEQFITNLQEMVNANWIPEALGMPYLQNAIL